MRKIYQSKPTRRAVNSGLLAIFAAACEGTGAETGLTQGEAGRVSGVRDGDLIVLDTGLSVRLAEIEAPRLSWREREADPFGEASKDMLELAALGRRAQLYYGGLMRDRYGRAIAHVIVKDETGAEIWLNGAMAHQGGARVRTWPDNTARVSRLYELETQARSLKAGLWDLPEYGVLSPDGFQDVRGRGLVIVEGVLGSVSKRDAEDTICLASDGVLQLALGARLIRAAENMALAPGARIRLRGGVRRDDDGRAYLAPDHWAQFERVV